MPVTFSALLEGKSGDGHGTGSFETGSFTPTAGRRLVAFVAAHDRSGSSQDVAAEFTITDSQGRTWTKRAEVGETSGFWRNGIAAWISDEASASSMTVTFDCGSVDLGQYYFGIFEITDSDGSIAGYVEAATSVPDDGAHSIVLGATPTADDLVVYARYMEGRDITGPTMPAGWTSVCDETCVSGNEFGSLGVVVNDGFTSDTISITDMRAAGTGYDAMNCAFIIPASSGPIVPMQRGSMAAAMLI